MADKDPHCFDVVSASVGMLSKENQLSLRISACRTLVHFINKMDLDKLTNLSEYVSSILESVDDLLRV